MLVIVTGIESVWLSSLTVTVALLAPAPLNMATALPPRVPTLPFIVPIVVAKFTGIVSGIFTGTLLLLLVVSSFKLLCVKSISRIFLYVEPVRSLRSVETATFITRYLALATFPSFTKISIDPLGIVPPADTKIGLLRPHQLFSASTTLVLPVMYSPYRLFA